ncbi:enoyl-CoA hydratase/isomerase family protein [Granulicoccus sp. GXG6511]|uniref:enoyl-CoA hydratase/isomerase family protein n=1 Tax=Granulicoccus sp. GXG6511 TaxID=3381351 RepID=UPI003D7EA166
MALVDYECRDAVGWITLANPDGGNAFNFEAADALAAAVRRAVHERVKVIVLRAEGRFFSVGGDLTGFTDAASFPDYLNDLATAGHRIIAELTRSDAIVVSVVQGTAAGIGFPIAMAADLVLASDAAKFTLGYTKVGLTGDGGTGLLARSLGLHRTLRLALLNDVLTAAEAHSAGLVARVFPAAELESAATEIIAGLAAGSRGAQAGIKRVIRAAMTDDVETQLAREARTMTSAAHDPDSVEGITAFLAKRPAEFAD